MAAVRRGQGPMKVELPNGSSASSDLPPISALFLIYFDVKAGYTISWKRSLPGIDLEGAVEYKSLPSGLHTVKEDLIYFVHDRFAGLSAFVNAPDAESLRNARMIAVGVLVPLSYGRLGRSWKHAEKLKEMAQELVRTPKDTTVLEEYWETHKGEENKPGLPNDSSLDSPISIRFKPVRDSPGRTKKHTRNRSASDGTALLPPGHILSAHHPAWSLSKLLSTFGPLIFPIYRAALLRKRILISCHAPVQETCDFVYDLSVLSNIPLAVTNLLSSNAPPQRLRPLFTIGVHDIPFLEDDLKASTAAATSSLHDDVPEETEDPGNGWIACTTDGILSMKDTLYDVLITLPQTHSASEEAVDKFWPRVESPRGTELKATQRDLRRYRALKWGLSRAERDPASPALARTNTNSTIDSVFGAPPLTGSTLHDSPMLDIPDTDDIVEPLSWSALAYTGFMWWASAGERQIIMDDEFENDIALLEGLEMDAPPHTPRTPQARSRSQLDISSMVGPGAESAKIEMAIIAYFHRMTTNTLTVLSDLVDTTSSDSEDELEETPINAGSDEEDDDLEGPVVIVRGDDMLKMGLDSWSVADQDFVTEVVRAYFSRKARVEGRNVDVCGIRIC